MRNVWADSYLQEAEDLLAEIQECALALDSENQSDEIVGRLFRAFHTIKGSGAMFGFDHVSKFTHHVETLLDGVREGRIAVSPQLAELVLAAADEIKRLLAVEPGEAPEPSEERETLIATLEAYTPVSALIPKAAIESVEQDNSAAIAQERSWQVVFRPSKDLFACGGNPLLLLCDLEKLGSMHVVAQTDNVYASDQRMLRGPGCWSEICDALKRCVRESGQDVGEVIAHWDFEAAAAFDHGDDSGHTRSGRFAPDVDPVAAAESDRPHGILRKVVAELQFWIIEEANQLLPNGKRVSAGLPGSALGQHRLAHLEDVRVDLGDQRRSLLMAQSMACGVVHLFVPRLSVDGE